MEYRTKSATVHNSVVRQIKAQYLRPFLYLDGPLAIPNEKRRIKVFPPKVAINQSPKSMIADKTVFYSRVITPTGRIVKEPTFLGALLAGVVLFAGIGALIFLCAFL